MGGVLLGAAAVGIGVRPALDERIRGVSARPAETMATGCRPERSDATGGVLVTVDRNTAEVVTGSRIG